MREIEMNKGIFTEEDIAFGAEHPTLGPNYSAAQRFMESVMRDFEDNHIKPLSDAVTKVVTDQITEKVWEVFQDSLLVDAEYNLQNAIRNMVDGTVKALLSGEKWAMQRYPLASKYEAEKVRAAIAAHIQDDLAKARIADLEADVANLRESLEWARR